MTSPLIIFGIGGSGTRLPALIAQEAGVHFGATNYALDADGFPYFSDKWLSPYLAQKYPHTMMLVDFARCLNQHTGALDQSKKWGIKHNQAILALGFWHTRLPTMRCIHIVRSMLDIACGPNQNQMQNHLADIIPDCQHAEIDARQAVYWTRANALAADYGEQHLGVRYLRLRFEDLCSLDAKVRSQQIVAILDLMQMPGSRDLNRLIKRPPSIGRWRQHMSQQRAAELIKLTEGQFERFGYRIEE